MSLLPKSSVPQRLTVLYDDSCEFCRRCRRWLESQAKYVRVDFLPLQAEETVARYPELAEEILALRFIVVTDQGDVYFDSDARLLCLWATYEYRLLAMSASGPLLRQVADSLFELVSRNRGTISRWLSPTVSQDSESACGGSCAARKQEAA